jgi:hypothetical protein
MEQVTILGLIVLYKIVCLLVGLAFSYMGYRLFLEDKTKSAGSLEASVNENKLKVTDGAPGVFFSLFGTILIVFSMLKGISYNHETPSDKKPPETTLRVIPDKPPF